ncbi:MAG: hypothetical protein ACOZE5_15910 [Verrucomicrobiota bacterium]
MIDSKELSPGRKAQKTARWARIMTKWLITFGGAAKTKWKFVEFGGPTGSESRGIVDILAVRKDHAREEEGLKRGDWFEMIFIQTKGGSAPRPKKADVERLSRLARLYHAKAVVLAEWKKGTHLQIYRLHGSEWRIATVKQIFGNKKEPSRHRQRR